MKITPELKIFVEFGILREKQFALRRQHPFDKLESVEDMDIMSLVSLAQSRNESCCIKQVLLAEIGTSATVRRRIDRLVELGILIKVRSLHDGRAQNLRISTKTIDTANKQAAKIKLAA